MKKTMIGIAVAGLLVAAFPGPVATAAIHTTTVGGAIQITGGAASEFIVLDCESGWLAINGADPDDGKLWCANITDLEVRAGEGDDQIDLSALDDVTLPSLAATEIFGQGGDDGITGSFIPDLISGQGGNDNINALPGDDTVGGGVGYDVITDQAGTVITLTDTSITGGGGTDALSGIEGADIVTSGATVLGAGTFSGNVWVQTSGNLNDTITTGSGDDEVSAGGGQDVISTNGGRDLIIDGDGNDNFNGGPGTDNAWWSGTMLTLGSGTASTPGGTDSFGDIEIAVFRGTGGSDQLDASGFDGRMAFFGAGGADVAVGGSGDDQLEGQGGNDDLQGRRGNDTLDGGSGRDRCAGGPGRNTLISC